MDVFAPYTGTLLLPDRAPFGSESPVTLADGRPVATIRWHSWSMRARYEILDPATGAVLAAGHRQGFGGRNYFLADARGGRLFHLKLSFWGPNRASALTLPTGRTLTTRGNWTSRRFSVTDEQDRPVAQLVNNSRILSMRPDSLAFELQSPVLSIVQAIGLAQSMRAAIESQRSAAAAASAG
ncbi:hypothetical protein Dvina_23715 [Dactylosporangium vinaceum]|uniref:Uncharacterized protein n=1 Tax=Dactylosporangium vinaceum TaxID=53362 RepID=A0ABV5MD04_9ACTN|nr:hypothetical protein [Dactylosporangium vinaceum]UAC00792.1 hypothetical protein Dvina_23715 [Dactylosporangium vinaceum]